MPSPFSALVLSGEARHETSRSAEPSPDTIVVNGLTDRRLMCYESPWGRRPVDGQAGARRPTSEAIGPQLKIVASPPPTVAGVFLLPPRNRQLHPHLGRVESPALPPPSPGGWGLPSQGRAANRMGSLRWGERRTLNFPLA